MRIDTMFTSKVAWLDRVSDTDAQCYRGLWGFSKYMGHSLIKAVEEMR